MSSSFFSYPLERSDEQGRTGLSKDPIPDPCLCSRGQVDHEGHTDPSRSRLGRLYLFSRRSLLLLSLFGCLLLLGIRRFVVEADVLNPDVQQLQSHALGQVLSGQEELARLVNSSQWESSSEADLEASLTELEAMIDELEVAVLAEQSSYSGDSGEIKSRVLDYLHRDKRPKTTSVATFADLETEPLYESPSTYADLASPSKKEHTPFYLNRFSDVKADLSEVKEGLDSLLQEIYPERVILGDRAPGKVVRIGEEAESADVGRIVRRDVRLNHERESTFEGPSRRPSRAGVYGSEPYGSLRKTEPRSQEKTSASLASSRQAIDTLVDGARRAISNTVTQLRDSAISGELKSLGSMDSEPTHALGREWSYKGEWSQGLMHGQGTLEFSDGWRYEGEWASGKMQGSGRLLHPTGWTYSGNWIGNRMDGEGHLTFADGWRYEGEWSRGQIHGLGELRVKRVPGNQIHAKLNQTERRPSEFRNEF